MMGDTALKNESHVVHDGASFVPIEAFLQAHGLAIETFFALVSRGLSALPQAVSVGGSLRIKGDWPEGVRLRALKACASIKAPHGAKLVEVAGFCQKYGISPEALFHLAARHKLPAVYVSPDATDRFSLLADDARLLELVFRADAGAKA